MTDHLKDGTMTIHITTRGDVKNAFIDAAKDLEKAAEHLRQAAALIHNGDVPNTCMHVIAVQGEMAKVDEIVTAFVRLQSDASEI